MFDHMGIEYINSISSSSDDNNNAKFIFNIRSIVPCIFFKSNSTSLPLLPIPVLS